MSVKRKVIRVTAKLLVIHEDDEKQYDLNPKKNFLDRFRKKSRDGKLKIFHDHIRIEPGMKVAEFGSGEGTYFLEQYLYRQDVLACDIGPHYLQRLKSRYPEVRTKVVDLEKPLPFKDKEFDVVFCNATIEHLENQEAFAKEVRRVAKQYFVSCPYKHFPFEMHFRLPFIQYLPQRLVKWLVNRFGMGNYPKGAYELILLPTKREMRGWFPDAKVFTFCYGYNLIAVKSDEVFE